MPEQAHSTTEADFEFRHTRDERRARVASLLPGLVERVRAGLARAGLRHDVFLVVPNSGEALLTYGTTAEPDPSDDEWEAIEAVVCRAVEDVLGIGRVVARDVACAAVRQPS